ncbi:MAG: TetR/AcrR family transcriptional regulator [Myxococcota bacterium]
MKRPSRGVGQHHGDLRRALIEAALAAVEQGDRAELSLRRLARRAGVSRAAPYHHFPDKDSLLAAVAREGFVQLGEAQDALPCDVTPAEHLHGMVTTYVRFACAHAAHYRVMFGVAPASLQGSPEGPALYEAANARFDALVDALAGLDPSAAPEELRRRAVVAWSLAHGAVQIAIDGLLPSLDAGLDVDALAERVGQATLAMARPGTGPSTPR